MKYFTIEELTASATAKRKGISNKPTADIVAALERLVENVLDPLREAWGAPIIVTSGYRSPKLNAAVGGARGSQHTYGQAADIRTVSDKPEDNRRLRDLLIFPCKCSLIKRDLEALAGAKYVVVSILPDDDFLYIFICHHDIIR